MSKKLNAKVAVITGAAKEIETTGGKAIAISMNVADEKQVNDGIAQAVKHFGQIDILVSNAGVQHIEAIDTLQSIVVSHGGFM